MSKVEDTSSTRVKASTFSGQDDEERHERSKVQIVTFSHTQLATPDPPASSLISQSTLNILSNKMSHQEVDAREITKETLMEKDLLVYVHDPAGVLIKGPFTVIEEVAEKPDTYLQKSTEHSSKEAKVQMEEFRLVASARIATSTINRSSLVNSIASGTSVERYQAKISPMLASRTRGPSQLSRRLWINLTNTF